MLVQAADATRRAKELRHQLQELQLTGGGNAEQYGTYERRIESLSKQIATDRLQMQRLEEEAAQATREAGDAAREVRRLKQDLESASDNVKLLETRNAELKEKVFEQNSGGGRFEQVGRWRWNKMKKIIPVVTPCPSSPGHF